MSRPILGIDPGVHGGIALMSDAGLQVWPMPILNVAKSNSKTNNEINRALLALILREIVSRHDTLKAYVEKVQAMPSIGPDGARRGMGAASAFKFGRAFEAPLMALACFNVPPFEVVPQRWQKDLKVPKGEGGSIWAASRDMPACSAYWKRKSVDGGVAAASLVALWGSRESGLDRTGILPVSAGTLL